MRGNRCELGSDTLFSAAKRHALQKLLFVCFCGASVCFLYRCVGITRVCFLRERCELFAFCSFAMHLMDASIKRLRPAFYVYAIWAQDVNFQGNLIRGAIIADARVIKRPFNASLTLIVVMALICRLCALFLMKIACGGEIDHRGLRCVM